MVAAGHADGMVTGMTRSYSAVYENIALVMDSKQDSEVFGLSIATLKNRTILIADTTVHEVPTAEQLADFAVQGARKAKQLGLTPRVALLAASNFGAPKRETSDRIQKAVEILDQGDHNFEYDGEMSVTMALDPDVRKTYPFCRLSGPANVFVMPAIHSASITSQMLQKFAGADVIGPVLMGLDKPVQIAQRGTRVRDLVTLAALAAYQAR